MDAYTICLDTICTGKTIAWAVDGKPCMYDTMREATAALLEDIMDTAELLLDELRHCDDERVEEIASESFNEYWIEPITIEDDGKFCDADGWQIHNPYARQE